jgi:hypothetical protein
VMGWVHGGWEKYYSFTEGGIVSTGSELLIFHSVPIPVHMKTLTKSLQPTQFSLHLLNTRRYSNYGVLYHDFLI